MVLNRGKRKTGSYKFPWSFTALLEYSSSLSSYKRETIWYHRFIQITNNIFSEMWNKISTCRMILRCWGKCAIVWSILSVFSRANRSSELACFHREAPRLFLVLWCSTAAGPHKKDLQFKTHIECLQIQSTLVALITYTYECNLLKFQQTDIVFFIFLKKQ